MTKLTTQEQAPLATFASTFFTQSLEGETAHETATFLAEVLAW